VQNGELFAQHSPDDEQWFDDYAEADGESVLTFAQAQERARARRPRANGDDDGGKYTVAKAMEAYFRFLESESRSSRTIRDARFRDEAFIRPKLGNVEAGTLTAERLRKWRDDLVRMAPRIRTRKGEPQRYKAGDEFFSLLRDEGRRSAQDFLETHASDLGRRSTLDLDVLLENI
jgi:hypothetical protein